MTAFARSVWSGLAVAFLAALISVTVAGLLPGVSALLVAILAGVAVGNLVALPEATAPGLQVAAKSVLRLGIVLLGLQLALGDVIALGWGVVGVVIAAVVLGFLASELIGRALGVPTGLRLLIGAGFSICGAAAVAAAEQVVPERKDEDVVTALALVVVCGTLMIPLLPLLVGVSGVSQQAAGVWIGASTHEVAQVVAAGGIVGSGALAAAVVVKLARVLLLAPVMIALSWRMRRSREGTLPPLVPVFVAGFIAAVALRSTGVLPPAVIDGAEVAQTVLLSSAMFALGCGVRLLTLRQVGGAPVLLAVLVTAVLIGVGLGGALLLG